MNKPYQVVLALGLTATALSSCSRANYASQGTVPAPRAEHAQSFAIAPEDAAVVTAAATPEVAPTEVVAPARQAAHALAQRAPKVAPVAAPVAAPAKAAPIKMKRQAVRNFVKRAMLAPQGTKAEGKSQLVALLLAVFIGTLGIARFYLGYTKRGILMLVLTILIIPAIVSVVLNILDIINIATDDLKPQDGDYTTKL